MTKSHPDDGKFVVVEGDQRVSGKLHETKEAAQTEADIAKKQKPVVEGQPKPPEQKVVQNLYGAIMLLLIPYVVSVCATTFTSLL